MSAVSDIAPVAPSTRVGYPAAAAHLGISVLALRSMVSRKRVPHYRLSAKCVVFDLADIDRWLAERRVAPEAR